ncbi:MAG: hypothetical protein DWQ01_06280 [Planctomycetota bacterium]|nr:MAG: hypothetical protein DWQ01_06280 [Planctomycetota bacterium]
MARYVKYTVTWTDAPPSHILQDDVAELEAIDLGAPLIGGNPLGQGLNDSSGSGSFTGIAPAFMSGMTVYLEVAALGSGWEDSNMLTVQIL